MKVGSFFTGYGGLDIAVGGDLQWYAEIEPAACQVLAAHYPDVPNLGDITKIDWTSVPAVDILTGGYPCQPFSHAGNRKGKDDERHLWPYVRDAIAILRPGQVILENVSGHLSLGFSQVLMDLADLGFDAEWGTLRASDVGAPHGRNRLFIVAHPNSRRYGEQQNAGAMESVDRRNALETQEWERSWAVADTGGNWGKYEPAIRRWEKLTREVPEPTVPHKDKRRLNPAFVEWMMGLPKGHVTGHGLSAAKELKMLGNGVVPQQAAAAIEQLMERITQ